MHRSSNYGGCSTPVPNIQVCLMWPYPTDIKHLCVCLQICDLIFISHYKINTFSFYWFLPDYKAWAPKQHPHYIPFTMLMVIIVSLLSGFILEYSSSSAVEHPGSLTKLDLDCSICLESSGFLLGSLPWKHLVQCFPYGGPLIIDVMFKKGLHILRCYFCIPIGFTFPFHSKSIWHEQKPLDRSLHPNSWCSNLSLCSPSQCCTDLIFSWQCYKFLLCVSFSPPCCYPVSSLQHTLYYMSKNWKLWALPITAQHLRRAANRSRTNLPVWGRCPVNSAGGREGTLYFWTPAK